jgi:isopenicillin N synthase-like dioxygenase
MENTIAPFVRKSLEVTYVTLDIFNNKLGLPKGTLERLHGEEEHSGSETRCIRSSPTQAKEAMKNPTLGAHSDFGSLVSILNKTHGPCLFY